MIPGFIITWFTFPGVIVHELAHALFCKWFGVDIFAVKYFQFTTGFGQPAGYVLHGPVDSATKNLLIAVGPFFVNSLLGSLIGAPASIPVFTFHSASPLHIFLVWLGGSIAMHSFPSRGDAASISRRLKDPDVKPFTRIWATPVVWLIHLGAVASIFWADLLWGFLLVGLVPNALVRLFA